jgi:hypothetical protein
LFDGCAQLPLQILDALLNGPVHEHDMGISHANEMRTFRYYAVASSARVARVLSGPWRGESTSHDPRFARI